MATLPLKFPNPNHRISSSNSPISQSSINLYTRNRKTRSQKSHNLQIPAITSEIFPRVVINHHPRPSNSTAPIQSHKAGWDALSSWAQILIIFGSVFVFVGTFPAAHFGILYVLILLKRHYQMFRRRNSRREEEKGK